MTDAELTARALLGMSTEVATWFSPKGPLTADELGLRFVDMSMALLRASRDGIALTSAELDLPGIDSFIEVYERRGGYGMRGVRANTRRGA